MSRRFEGSIVVVTGGASGIGRACAELFASEGAHVVVNDVNKAAAEALAQTLARTACKAIAVEADAADANAVDRAAEEVIRHFGRIDVLVNNAGIACHAPALSYPLWEKMLAVDLSGPFYWSRAVVARSMAMTGNGAIVNVASGAGLRGFPNDVGYISAKHGVVGLTKALAIEWASLGIRVNCVCPGSTVTPMLQEVVNLTPERERQKSRAIPIGRLLQPIEQARVIAFLASADASGVTGAIVPVDGGKSALHAGHELPQVTSPIAVPPLGTPAENLDLLHHSSLYDGNSEHPPSDR